MQRGRSDDAADPKCALDAQLRTPSSSAQVAGASASAESPPNFDSFSSDRVHAAPRAVGVEQRGRVVARRFVELHRQAGRRAHPRRSLQAVVAQGCSSMTSSPATARPTRVAVKPNQLPQFQSP